METEIKFEHIGIADILARYRLKVPLNQREYSWEDEHVEDLLRDISNSIRTRPAYFLGTIVLTVSRSGAYQVADGQQRLATTTMILAAIRDFYLEMNDPVRAAAIESKFLFEIDMDSGERLPKLALNSDDNVFFLAKVLAKPTERSGLEPSRHSHTLIQNAFSLTRKYLEPLKEQYGPKGFSGLLKDWRQYLTENAVVILLRAPNALNAFLMFHTLNDRGLKTSQADLVKNHLFEQAGEERISEAQGKWSSLRGAIDSTGDDDLIMDYLRHACCLLYGHTRDREMFEKIETAAKGPTEATKLLHQLSEMANDYCAILNAEHSAWADYNGPIRDSIRALSLMKVSQIRPLMLAVKRKFTAKRTMLAFDRCVSWSVRFIISGGGRGGTVEELYATMAHLIYEGKITTVEQMDAKARGIVPTDAQFEAAFATARVNVAKLARYLLRSLEFNSEGHEHPGWSPMETIDINLEHVMPQTVCAGWPEVTERDIETHGNRLGNQVLLPANVNSIIDRNPFKIKKAALGVAPYTFTKHVSEAKQWGLPEIEQRQKTLAHWAVRTWPIG